MVEYLNGATRSEDTTIAETRAAIWCVRRSPTSTGDVAYGIYTITKAHPEIRITAEGTTYNSMRV